MPAKYFPEPGYKTAHRHPELSCGRTAVETTERAFWQSRMTTAGARAEPLELTNITELAKRIRRTQ